MGVVSGRYRSLSDRAGEDTAPRTVIELFGRMDDGRSVCLLVHGLRPTFEIAPIGQWKVEDEIAPFLKDRLRSVATMDHVADIRGPEVKWTMLGQRPVWTVEVEQPFHVPALRKALKSQSWQVFSGDIPFVNRLFLDLSLIHI